MRNGCNVTLPTRGIGVAHGPAGSTAGSIAVGLLLLGIGLAFGCVRSAPPPNLLFIVVDTLRKDGLGLYGNPLPVSPRLDALAARSWVFDEHMAHATQTVPSTLTMLLSQLPAEHGFTFRTKRDFADERPVYPDELHFLAEALQDAGFATAGFTANPYLTARNRFDQGFEAFGTTERAGEHLTERALGWLYDWRTRPERRPFFVYLHYMDVHQPYQPPEPFRTRFVGGRYGRDFRGNVLLPDATEADRDYNQALYAGATAYLDQEIGRLLSALEALGVHEHTIAVVTSDHGEEFLEHGGIGHGTSLYGELVRVPLLLSPAGPARPGRRVGHLSHHLDLAPTLLTLLNVEVPPSFRGRSLFAPAERTLLDTLTWRGIIEGPWKLLVDEASEQETLFALPDELDSTPVANEEVAARLRPPLAEHRRLAREEPSHAAPDPAAAWSEEEKKRLRALGYAD